MAVLFETGLLFQLIEHFVLYLPMSFDHDSDLAICELLVLCPTFRVEATLLEEPDYIPSLCHS